MKDNIDNKMKGDFAMKQGESVTDRMVPDLLQAILDVLPNEIEYNGKKCILKPLGKGVVQSNGSWSILFDIKDPDDTYDHVEFCIEKTGWGRSI